MTNGAGGALEDVSNGGVGGGLGDVIDGAGGALKDVSDGAGGALKDLTGGVGPVVNEVTDPAGGGGGNVSGLPDTSVAGVIPETDSSRPTVGGSRLQRQLDVG